MVFKPGHCPNPSGRPRHQPSVVYRLRYHLTRPWSEWDGFEEIQAASKGKRFGKFQACDMVAKALIYSAVADRNASSAKEIMERIDGKVVDRIEVDIGEGLIRALEAGRQRVIEAKQAEQVIECETTTGSGDSGHNLMLPAKSNDINEG